MARLSVREFSAIESNVPIPQPYRTGGYPWRELNIGQSFLVEATDVDRTRNSLTSCRRNAEKKTGRKFILRTVPMGIRIWRVK